MSTHDKSEKAVTARQVQSSLFIGSLRKELDKLSSNNDQLVKEASSYLSEGCSESETIELLMIDGYSRGQILACINKISDGREENQADTAKWGFSIEDAYGRVITSSDLSLEIEAASKEEAWKKAEEMVDTDESGDQLLEVHKL